MLKHFELAAKRHNEIAKEAVIAGVARAGWGLLKGIGRTIRKHPGKSLTGGFLVGEPTVAGISAATRRAAPKTTLPQIGATV